MQTKHPLTCVILSYLSGMHRTHSFGPLYRCVVPYLVLQVIADYHTPEGKSLTRDLMGTINASVDFLVRCRPLSVSMGNAIKALKLYLSKIDPAGEQWPMYYGYCGIIRWALSSTLSLLNASEVSTCRYPVGKEAIVAWWFSHLHQWWARMTSM